MFCWLYYMCNVFSLLIRYFTLYYYIMWFIPLLWFNANVHVRISYLEPLRSKCILFDGLIFIEPFLASEYQNSQTRICTLIYEMAQDWHENCSRFHLNIFTYINALAFISTIIYEKLFYNAISNICILIENKEKIPFFPYFFVRRIISRGVNILFFGIFMKYLWKN